MWPFSKKTSEPPVEKEDPAFKRMERLFFEIVEREKLLLAIVHRVGGMFERQLVGRDYRQNKILELTLGAGGRVYRSHWKVLEDE